MVTSCYRRRWTNSVRAWFTVSFFVSFSSAFASKQVLVVVVSYLILRRITSSPFGKVLEAIRDDELAAKFREWQESIKTIKTQLVDMAKSRQVEPDNQKVKDMESRI
ncbi:MAG: branched-chain amino acid ABC transporter permease, partial [Planctomycetes bacterium]|nr:branched-chain amino acid ABC transporter permease [Planctomycetota bacterium]